MNEPEYLLYHAGSGRAVVGAKASELVAQIGGVGLVGRSLFINGIRYNSYTDEWTDSELLAESARDAVRYLVSNHGWRLYKA